MNRRDFIIQSTAAACMALGDFSLSGCSSYRSVGFEEINGKIRVKKSEMLPDKAVLVKAPKANAPVFLSAGEGNSYQAVLLLCTHKQCELKPSGTVLACPCHGAEFSLEGKVLKEPAERDLYKYDTSEDEHYIYIHLK